MGSSAELLQLSLLEPTAATNVGMPRAVGRSVELWVGRPTRVVARAPMGSNRPQLWLGVCLVGPHAKLAFVYVGFMLWWAI